MKNMIKFLLFIVLITSLIIGYATVYMSIDKNGNVSYSDTPSRNANVVNAPETSRFQPKPLPSPDASVQTTEPNKNNYTAFAISDPIDQQTFQNQRDIPVSFVVTPNLQATDKIQLYLDNKPYGPAKTATNFLLLQLDRGSHQIYAELLDSNQTVLLKTNSITIFVHYAAVGGQ